MTTHAPVLELFKLSKAYPTPKGSAVIVKDFTLNFAAGEFITLIGHSGCGKSTVLSMVAGLTDITEGAMILSGRETNQAGPDRGVVFQSPCLLPWMSAFENVMLGVNQVYFTVSATRCTSIPVSSPRACASASASPVPSRSSRKCSC
jgi:ABC-type nitrate/sulfonate/bicarbonate transport system ATPase subunit